MSVFREIRDQLDIVSVANRYTKLTEVGNGRYKGLCPLHSEKTPSFMVDADNGLFYCFGCHAGGDVISLIEQVEGISHADLIDYVQREYGVTVSNTNYRQIDKTERKQQAEVLQLMYEFFFERNKKIAVEYTAKRLSGPDIRGKEREIAEKIVNIYSIFVVDWEGSREFINLLAEKNLLAAAYALGVLYKPKEHKASPYSPFVDRLVVPIKKNGEIVAFNGRTLKNKDPKYLLTKNALIFKKTNTLFGLREAIDIAKAREKKTVYLVEGVMDAISLVSRGLPAVAYLGSSIHRNQYNLLTRAFENVVIIPDSDSGGSKGLISSLETAITSGFSLPGQVMFLPKDMDINDFLKKYSVNDLKDLRITTFEDAFISYYVYQAKKNSPTSRVSPNVIASIALQNILPKLIDYSTNITSQKVLIRVATRFGIDIGTLQASINKGIAEGQKNIKKDISNLSFVRKAKLKASPIEITMLGILQANPKLLVRLQEEPWYIFTSVYFRDIAESFYEAEVNNKTFSEILMERIGTEESVVDDYLRIVMTTPKFEKELAESMFETMLANMASLFEKKEEKYKRANALITATTTSKTLYTKRARDMVKPKPSRGFTKEDIDAVLEFTEALSNDQIV